MTTPFNRLGRSDCAGYRAGSAISNSRAPKTARDDNLYLVIVPRAVAVMVYRLDQSTIASGNTYFIGFTGRPFTQTS